LQVYLITNNINNKIYVGQDSKNRPNYYGSGRLILNAIKKYGKENFTKTILQECSTQEELDEAEEYWINFYQSYERRKHGYNISKNARGGNLYALLTEDEKKITRQKLSDVGKRRHQKMTEEEKKILYEKIHNTRKLHLKQHSENWKKTYYNKSIEELNDIKKKKSKGMKSVWNNRTKEEKENLRNKISQSAKGKRRQYLPDGSFILVKPLTS